MIQKPAVLPARMPIRKAMLVVAAMAVLLLSEAGLHFSYTPDDSFIYFQYARNFARSGEVAFNPGEPSYGITGPVWMMLAALMELLTGDIVRATKVLDLLCALSALPVFFCAARRITTDVHLALLALCAFAVNSWFIRWAGSGMESSMAVLVVSSVLWGVLAGRTILTLTLLGILVLLRPESLVLFPVVVWRFLTGAKRSGGGWKALLPGVALYLGIVLAWGVCAKLMTGSFVPNTSVKSGGIFSVRDLWETGMDTARTILVTDGTMVAACIVLLFLLSRRTTPASLQGDERPGPAAFLGVWMGVMLGFYVFSATNVVSRYLLLVTPCIPLLCLVLFERVRQTRPRGTARMFKIAVLAVGLHLLSNQLLYWTVVEPGIMNFAKGMEDNFVRLGRWLRENTPEGSRVLVADIGAIGFYSGRPLDDAAGLISPKAIPLLRAGVRPYDMIASGMYTQWSRPDYVIHAEDIPEALATRPSLIPVLFTEFPGMRLDHPSSRYYTLYRVRP